MTPPHPNATDHDPGLPPPMKHLAIKALAQIEASVSAGIWEAHLGCGALAGAFLIHEKFVQGPSVEAIMSRAQAQVAGATSGPRDTTSISLSRFTQAIVQEISVNAEVPKEIGHDVIYAAYVLQALHTFDIAPWSSLLDALTTQIRRIKESGPGWITLNGENQVRPLAEAVEADVCDYWRRFAQFDRPRPMEVGDMQLGHLLTHGHAITLLRHHVTDTTLAALDVAYRKRVRGLLVANESQIDQTPLRQSAVDPRHEAYWRQMKASGDMHGHVMKYAYSFLDLTKATGPSAQDLVAFGRVVWPARARATTA